MRLPVDALHPLIAAGLSIALAGCGLIGGGGGVASLDAGQATAIAGAPGPSADYPMVLGEPFTVEGELYTPADTLNFDVVGYASLDGAAGVTAAHRTLPLPSYAEVTSLESGKTILVRVERRGPMSGRSMVALSPSAAAQLGAIDGAPVRVRRVNPAEADRAELRAGRAAPERIDTPKSLVEVLRRKLPATGAAPLRPVAALAAKSAAARPAPATSGAVTGPGSPPAPTPMPKVVGAYPLPSISSNPPGRSSVASQQGARRPAASTPSAKGAALLVQAATFSSRANADRAARALGGSVTAAGRLFRVNTGPFTTRQAADAALAKVRAAGYSDARVTTAG